MADKDIQGRIRKRIPEEEMDNGILDEYIQTVKDRLCIRLGADELPVVFQSICVDAVVKMWRRTYYEGITSENVANLSTTFVNDILSEYSEEIGRYLNNKANTSGSNKVVKFL